MSAEVRQFSVDLDQLDKLADRIRGLAGFITDQLVAIDQKAKEVEAVWSGSAAAAYSEAHTEWTAGATAIQEGLAALHEAAKHAHTGYIGAVAENLRILGI
ncbi:WXG100 family type VII secretion target [Nocardia anaemiae]|uniref:WXG100 family type VII secretion target n=1 Tax=Nocardia anaemiae TaxID=263910 RepID=UPI0007A49360|nr:WXG100 family type VII secretion target [Nocardia anaemiae]